MFKITFESVKDLKNDLFGLFIMKQTTRKSQVRSRLRCEADFTFYERSVIFFIAKKRISSDKQKEEI